MQLTAWFNRVVLSRRWLTFLVMGVAFLAFGAGSYNLVMLFQANVRVISNYGWQALMDGALRQLVELVVTGYLSMAAYVVFKACEHRLTKHLSEPPGEEPKPVPEAVPGSREDPVDS